MALRTTRPRRLAPTLLATALLLPALGACTSGDASGTAGATASTVTTSATPTSTPTTTEETPSSIPTETAPPLTPTRPTTTTTPPPAPRTSTPTSDPGPTAIGSCSRTLPTYPTLEPGATGPAVSALQCFLDDADFGPVTVDGRYGRQTQAAVTRVEATFEGPAPHPGRIDSGFWVLIISRSLGDRTLKPGMTGSDVTTLQRALRAAGATLAVDGRYGPQTKQAVERLQDANRLGVDGVVGEDTLFLLKNGATIG